VVGLRVAWARESCSCETRIGKVRERPASWRGRARPAVEAGTGFSWLPQETETTYMTVMRLKVHEVLAEIHEVLPWRANILRKRLLEYQKYQGVVAYFRGLLMM
jgi:hypothetical protein